MTYLNVVILLLFVIMCYFLATIASSLSQVLKIIAIILICIAVIQWYIMSRFNKVRVSIDEDKIIYKNYKGEKIIKLEDIDRIQFLTIKYTGGWMKIRSNKKTIRFTMVIKDIHRLSIELKKYLDTKGLNQVYKEKHYKNFIKTAAYIDDSLERIYKIWWKLMLSTIGISVMGILLGILLGLGEEKTLIFAIIVFFYPNVVFSITEFIFAIKVGRLFKKDMELILKRDTLYEKRIYKNVIIWSLLVYMPMVIVFMLVI